MSGEQAAGGWKFRIDRGGTFTDVVVRRPDGAWLGDDVDRYSFIAADLHRLLLAGLPARLSP